MSPTPRRRAAGRAAQIALAEIAVCLAVWCCMILQMSMVFDFLGGGYDQMISDVDAIVIVIYIYVCMCNSMYSNVVECEVR